MSAATMFGMTTEEFQTVITVLTTLNFLMIVYTFWLRAQIKKASKSIDENHKKTLEIANSVFSSTQFKHYEKFKNYDKLSSKNNWYIFGLVNLSLYNKEKKEDELLNIFESFEVIAATWCKRPEDVADDYMMIIDGYKKEEPAKVGQPVLSGGHF